MLLMYWKEEKAGLYNATSHYSVQLCMLDLTKTCLKESTKVPGRVSGCWLGSCVPEQEERMDFLRDLGVALN